MTVKKNSEFAGQNFDGEFEIPSLKLETST